MPFKFGMRKACRYAVSSKNAYVVCVHMLDRPLMDCILTFESTGRECLENVALRIGLNDVEYFGLRYVDRRLQFRWVELDRPLKKQLDKRAQSPLLYFGVMFYISDIMSIHDPMAQYQYYLHLKADIIEGKLQCSPEQAVLFAAYAVQAEHGDYDPQVHNADYLTGLSLLPKNMTTEDSVHKQLLHEIAIMHQRLHGVPPLTAELQYVLEAQQLDDYGLEYYPVKDMSGTDLRIGASFVGIFIRANGDQPTVYFKWSDISGFSHNRKVFGIDTTLSDKPFQFQLDDADAAKYVFTMCKLQLAFYKSYITQHSATATPLGSTLERMRFPAADNTGNSQMQDGPSDQTVIINESVDVSIPSNNTPSYKPFITSDTVAQAAGPYSATDVCHSEPKLPVTGSYHADSAVHSSAGSSYLRSEKCVGDRSCTVVPQSSQSGMPSGLSQEALYRYRIPSYRQAPDYEMAMQQKQQPTHGQHFMHPDVLSYSQPDIYQQTPVSYHWNPGALQLDSDRLPGHPVDRAHSLVMRPWIDSTGVVRHSSAAAAIISNPDSHLYYRAPPPYPRQSSSTPDLASPTMLAAAALVNRHPPGVASQCQGAGPVLAVQSEFDQSLENLAIDVNRLQLYEQRLMESEVHNVSSSKYSSRSNNNNNSDQSLSDITRQGIIQQMCVHSVMPQQNAEMLQYHTAYQLDGKSAQNGRNESSVPPQFAVRPSAVTQNTVEGYKRDTEHAANAFVHRSSSRSRTAGFREANSPDFTATPPLSAMSFHHHRTTDSSGSAASSTSLSAHFGAVGSCDSDTQFQYVLSGKLSQNGGAGAYLHRDQRHVLETKLESQLFTEFEQIAKKRLKYECSIATLERNRERNRFKDVVPYDDNRVKLTPTKNNPDGYINASHIRVKVADEEFWHIAAQGPLINTVGDFWQMIWEYNVVVVAMLTASGNDGSQKSDRQKCAQYWPDKLGSQYKLTVDDYEITLRCTSGTSPYITSGLLVRHNPSGQQRVVWHLQYTDWPDRTDRSDHDCPSNYHGFLDYLSEIEAIRRQVNDGDGTMKRTLAPVVVHCSAGVGRSGVVILIEIMKASLERNQMVDVPKVLASLRDQRMYIVQTVTQYCYVYRTLVAYLQSSRLI